MSLSAHLKGPLRKHTRKDTLHAPGCGVKKIDKLPPEETNFRGIFLSHNEITSLATIGQFRFLEILVMEYNKIRFIEDLAPLESLRFLTTLNLTGNPVCSLPLWDVHVLKLCPHLKILNRQKLEDRFGANLKRRDLLDNIRLESEFHVGFLN